MGFIIDSIMTATVRRLFKATESPTDQTGHSSVPVLSPAGMACQSIDRATRVVAVCISTAPPTLGGAILTATTA